jgi:hypothetical protein
VYSITDHTLDNTSPHYSTSSRKQKWVTIQVANLRYRNIHQIHLDFKLVAPPSNNFNLIYLSYPLLHQPVASLIDYCSPTATFYADKLSLGCSCISITIFWHPKTLTPQKRAILQRCHVLLLCIHVTAHRLLTTKIRITYIKHPQRQLDYVVWHLHFILSQPITTVKVDKITHHPKLSLPPTHWRFYVNAGNDVDDFVIGGFCVTSHHR